MDILLYLNVYRVYIIFFITLNGITDHTPDYVKCLQDLHKLFFRQDVNNLRHKIHTGTPQSK